MTLTCKKEIDKESISHNGIYRVDRVVGLWHVVAYVNLINFNEK